MERPVASVSIDLDNLWSYLKTHGDSAWESWPSFLARAVPRLLDLLGEQDITATVFVVGADAVRDDGAEAVRAIAAGGHEVGNHSFHHEPWLHLYSVSQMEDEVARAEEAIVAAGAARPVGFRGPGYSVTDDLLAVLARRGYRYDASTLPTWIGPIARAVHNRSMPRGTRPAKGQEDLFGGFSRVRSPIRPYRWDTDGGPIVELPVTTMPFARVPIHGSYLVQLYQVAPWLARAYLDAALRLCRTTGTAPSMLLHPTDVLDRHDAPGMDFFPGMGVPAAEKIVLVRSVLDRMSRHYDVVGTGRQVDQLPTLLPVVTARGATAGRNR
ncbi:polysaccharide deacetylase family protein [Pseudonocardia abyssalis]|nr:polysaccharide deacetylase family protein [Pseudonocardia abyssalis]